MATYQHAPILEAAIDVHFDPGFSARDRVRLRDKFKKKMPAVQETFSVDVKIENGKANAVPQSTGFRLDSSTGDSVIMIGLGSLTTVKLAPYRDWEHLIGQAQANMDVLYKIMGPKAISRIGTRFINRFDIKEGEQFLESNHLLTIFSKPENLGDMDIRNCAYQYDGVDPETGFTLRVAAGNCPSPIIKHNSCILDIDVFLIERVHKQSDIWERFERMRALKNRVFEASITDAMREALG